MSLHFYISPIIGTGLSMDDPIRPAVHDIIQGVGHAIYCSSSGKNWCLVLADIDSALDTQVRSVSGVTALPAAGVALNTLSSTDRTNLLNVLSLVGEAIYDADYGRDLLTRLGTKHCSDFDLKHSVPNIDTNAGLL